MVWYSYLFESFPQLVMIQSYNVVNESEVDVFLEFPCFLYDPANVCNLISSSSAFFETQFEHLEFLGSRNADA